MGLSELPIIEKIVRFPVRNDLFLLSRERKVLLYQDKYQEGAKELLRAGAGACRLLLSRKMGSLAVCQCKSHYLTFTCSVWVGEKPAKEGQQG